MNSYAKDACQTRVPGNAGLGKAYVDNPREDVCAGAPVPEPRTLDQLVGNAVSYVEEVGSVRAQAAAIRERLVGSWPEDCSKSSQPGEPGLLGALGQFQSQAWSHLWELREHLNAIQKALG